MKITLDIPNEHAPALLALLSDLMPVRLEPQADPAEGHPELPLGRQIDPEVIENIRDLAGLTPKKIGRVMGDEISLDAQPDDESEEIAETRWAPVPGIDAADPLKVEMEDVRIFPPKSFGDASTVPPVVGESFWMRNGEVIKVIGEYLQAVGSPSQFEAITDGGVRLFFNSKGMHCANKCYDLVQQCPF